MSKSIPKVKPGFFLARKALKAGGWLYGTFPVKDKAYYLQAWQEVAPEVAISQSGPVVPPTVTLPESPAISNQQAAPKKGRPKAGTDGKSD